VSSSSTHHGALLCRRVGDGSSTTPHRTHGHPLLVAIRRAAVCLGSVKVRAFSK
jgi:hypothetical protein